MRRREGGGRRWNGGEARQGQEGRGMWGWLCGWGEGGREEGREGGRRGRTGRRWWRSGGRKGCVSAWARWRLFWRWKVTKRRREGRQGRGWGVGRVPEGCKQHP